MQQTWCVVNTEIRGWVKGSGAGEVQIELFINEPQAVASKPFPVNPKANSSKLAIGRERDATNHPGKEYAHRYWYADRVERRGEDTEEHGSESV